MTSPAGFLLFLLLWMAAPLRAEPVDLQTVESGARMQRYWDMAMLPADMTIDEVRGTASDRWVSQPAQPFMPQAGMALWLRFDVAPFGPLTPTRWVLELPRPGLDRVDMFRFEEQDLTLNEVSGDELSVAVWPVSGRFPVFDVVATNWKPVTYYLKISHGEPLSLTGVLKNSDHHMRTQRTASLSFGAFFGAIALLFALAAAALITTRQLAYAGFAAYALATALAFLSASGLLGEWWPEGAPHAIDRAPYSLSLVAAAMGLLYLTLAVGLREMSRARFYAVAGLAAAGLVLAGLLHDANWPATLPTLCYGVLALGTAAWLLLHAGLKGESWTRSHALSLAPYAMALSYPLAEAQLGVHAPPQTFALIAGGAMVHLALTYFALSAKVKVLRETTMRLDASATVDPLTGAANFRRLKLRAPGLFARARHYRHQGALLLVEITNLAEFRRVGGQRGAEMALVQTAAMIRGCVKNIDMVSRVDDAHFGVAVEGPLTDKEASSIAAHMIARGLRTATEPPHLTPLALRVFIEMVPKETESLEELLIVADRRLRAIPLDDPRRIFFGDPVGDPAPPPG